MNKHIAESDKVNEQSSNIEKARNRIDLISTIILSLATVLSSWCAFQSSQWNGEQYFHIDDENIADNKRLQNEIAAVQRKAGESNYFLYYLNAIADGDTLKKEFLESRFPPHLKKAIIAWKATDPLNDPSAPVSPFLMEEYVAPEIIEARKFQEQAMAFKKAANQADRNADNYLLLSILIAMVLFFTGLSGITRSGKYQRMLLLTALIVLIMVIVLMLRLPVMI